MPRIHSVNDRRYEHPVDFRRPGEYADRIGSFALTDHQIGLIEEQIPDPEKRLRAVKKMTAIALQQLHLRSAMEFSSLHTLGVDQQANEAEFQRYLEMAGDPEKLGEYICWFHELAVSSLARMQSTPRSRYSRDTNSITTVEIERHAFAGTKGPSVELGSAIMAGDWTYSAILDYWMSTIGTQLDRVSEFDVTLFDSQEVLKRYTVKHSGSEFPVVRRERPYADIRDGEHTLHVAKRSQFLLVNRKPDVVMLYGECEEILTRQDRANPILLPESTTYYLRMPHNPDIE